MRTLCLVHKHVKKPLQTFIMITKYPHRAYLLLSSSIGHLCLKPRHWDIVRLHLKGSPGNSKTPKYYVWICLLSLRYTKPAASMHFAIGQSYLAAPQQPVSSWLPTSLPMTMHTHTWFGDRGSISPILHTGWGAWL